MGFHAAGWKGEHLEGGPVVLAVDAEADPRVPRALLVRDRPCRERRTGGPAGRTMFHFSV